MVKRLLTLLFTSVLALSLAMPVLAQENTKKEEAQGPPAQGKAETPAKVARWEGMVVRSSTNQSTLTVRKSGSTAVKIIRYDSSTQWTSQEHGSKKVNKIDASQVKDGDRVICLGTYDNQGVFHATLISKRLTK